MVSAGPSHPRVCFASAGMFCAVWGCVAPPPASTPKTATHRAPLVSHAIIYHMFRLSVLLPPFSSSASSSPPEPPPPPPPPPPPRSGSTTLARVKRSPRQRVPTASNHSAILSSFFVYLICIDEILKGVIGTFLTFMTPV